MMARLDPIIRTYHRVGMALSVAQTACAANGREEPFAADMRRVHKTFRFLAEELGYRVMQSGDVDVLVPRDTPLDGKIVRPVFGRRPTPADGPEVA